MAKLGSNEDPAFARVKTLERAEEIMALCNEGGWKISVGIEPNKPEDISDVDRLLNPIIIKRDKPKVGRNDPCPCGSGLKFKKCCLQK
jgi:SWIM/SEC-C metal-binding protein